MIRGLTLLLLLLPLGALACNPFACTTEARSATYVGRLGEATPPGTVADGDSGRIFLMLNEWRGSSPQLSTIVSVKVKGFVSSVSEVDVLEGTPAQPGRLLWSRTTGLLVGDTTWNGGPDLFAGPASWTELWTLLDRGTAFFEVRSSSGASVSGGLRKQESTPFSPACT